MMGKSFDEAFGGLLLRLRGLPALASADRGIASLGTAGVAHSRKQMLLACALVIVVAGFAWALWPKPVGVDVVVVSAGPMTVTVDEEGKTRIKDVFVVSAPIAGKVLRSPLLAGDLVERHRTVVAVIEPSTPPFLDARSRLEAEAHVKAAEAATALAEAELKQARSEAEFAERELVRARALSRNATVPARTVEKAELDAAVRRAAVTKAEASVAVRQRELESARARLVGPGDQGTLLPDASCCLEVRAPASGRVLKVLQTSEQVVQTGAALVEIGDPRTLEIVVELLSTDAVKVREGARAEIDGWGGRERIQARVRRIESSGFTKVSALGIEEQRVRVVLDLDSEATATTTLGHEFRVFVRIEQWSSEKALAVPIGALFRRDGKWAVFKVADRRAVLVPVEVGNRNGQAAEITAGLKAGDWVVMHPSDRVADGVRIAERQVEPPGR